MCPTRPGATCSTEKVSPTMHAVIATIALVVYVLGTVLVLNWSNR